MNKFLRRFSLGICILTSFTLFSQTRPIGQVISPAQIAASTTSAFQKKCGTLVPDAAWDTWFNAKVEEYKENIRLGKAQSVSYQIPIIVHVVHGGQSVGTYPNLSQAQINSQIPILNADYAGTGLNVGNYSSTSFTVPIANAEITFCAATKDPNGNTLAEPGIDRINYVSKGWSDPASAGSISSFRNIIENSVKPGSIWDPTKYLNIWVTDVSASVGLLGYATFPSGTGLSGLTSGLGTATTDGVWNWAKAYGNTGTLQAPYNEGRTATHEVGHWLGLRHIGGDGNNNSSGDCNATDYCNDTPPQRGGFSGGSFGQNYGAPTFPRNSGCGTPNGDMFMNFMDYTDDAIMYMFTPDQKARMQTAMQQGSFRTGLNANAATVCNGGGGGASGCSTVVTVATSNTLGVISAGCSGASPGYVYGTNCYNDKEKAEFFSGSQYGNAPGQLNRVTVLFYQTQTKGTYGTPGTPVNLKIYQGTNAGGPTTLIGTTSVSMGVLNSAPIYSVNTYCGNQNVAYNEALVLPYTFTVSPALSVPSTGFYVSVEIPSNAASDTVVVLNNLSVSANNTWERQSDNLWYSMSASWSGLGNKGMGILPVVCGQGIGLNEQTVINNAFIVRPNPSNGQFKLTALNAALEKEQTLEVYNAIGQLVFKQSVKIGLGEEVTVDLKDVTNGIYILQLSGSSNRTLQKICVQR